MGTVDTEASAAAVVATLRGEGLDGPADIEVYVPDGSSRVQLVSLGMG